jgi:microcystin-dependent protein
MPENEPAVCRLFSVPASLLPALDGAVATLCAPSLWTRGDDVASASVADVTAAFADAIEGAYEGGCRVVGQVMELATNTIPDWGLPCDGSTYLGADYPELWAVISDGLKVDETHFRTPDRYQRFGMGGPPVGSQGGENTHTLTTSEMPAHGHDQLDHVHGVQIPILEGLALGPGEEPVVIGQTPALTAGAQAVILSSGGGNAHNNLPQWEGALFVIVARSQ